MPSDLQKPASALDNANISFKDLFTNLGKAALEFSQGKYLETAKSLLDLFGSIKQDSLKWQELAWLLVYRSLCAAIFELVHEHRDLVQQTGNYKFCFQKLNSSVKKILLENEYKITAEFFRYPDKFKAIQDINDQLEISLNSLGMSAADSHNIAKKLPSRFAAHLLSEWNSNYSEYKAILDSHDNPFSEFEQDQLSWAKYNLFLRNQPKQPLFDETFSLEDVYIPLRGVYKSWDTVCSSMTDAFEDFHLVELEEHVEHWVEYASANDTILFLTGGPGSGKSSFLKVMAAKLSHNESYRILFIPLNHFSLEGKLEAAIDQYVIDDRHLQQNPLRTPNAQRRCILAFDGLDELSESGPYGREIAKRFIEYLENALATANRHEVSVVALVSGRQLAIQEFENKYRKTGSIITLQNYAPCEDEFSANDMNVLAQIDYRDAWWDQYYSAKGISKTGMPNELKNQALEDVTSQPLLNYLVALAMDKGLSITEDTNLNSIYERLVTSVLERPYGGYRHASELNEHEFFALLEEIALTAWHGGEIRTTTYEAIQKRCGEKKRLKNILDKISEDSDSQLSRLLLAFFFAGKGTTVEGDKAVEFTHKSFGEYLVAKKIVRELKLIYDRTEQEGDLDENEALGRVIAICGHNSIDHAIYAFLDNEISLQNPNSVFHWQQLLAELLEFVMKHSVEDSSLQGARASAKITMLQNTYRALLLLHNCCGNVTKKQSALNVLEQTSFSSFLNFITHNTQSITTFSREISYLELSNQRFFENRFSNFLIHNCTFTDCDFTGCVLYNANFVKCTFVMTSFFVNVCARSLFKNCRFDDFEFYESLMKFSDMYHCELKRVNWAECDLSHSTFTKSSISKSTFQHSVLTNLAGITNNFNEIRIIRCIINDTNLSETEIEDNKIADSNVQDIFQQLNDRDQSSKELFSNIKTNSA